MEITLPNNKNAELYQQFNQLPIRKYVTDDSIQYSIGAWGSQFYESIEYSKKEGSYKIISSTGQANKITNEPAVLYALLATMHQSQISENLP